jgi:hypothetical protein
MPGHPNSSFLNGCPVLPLLGPASVMSEDLDFLWPIESINSPPISVFALLLDSKSMTASLIAYQAGPAPLSRTL